MALTLIDGMKEYAHTYVHTYIAISYNLCLFAVICFLIWTSKNRENETITIVDMKDCKLATVWDL